MIAEGRLCAKICVAGKELPARIRLFHFASNDGECILDCPFIDAETVIEVWDSDNPNERTSLKANGRSAKWESRLNRRIRRERFSQLIFGEDDFIPGNIGMRMLNYYQGEGDCAIWCFAAEWQIDSNGSPRSGMLTPDIRCFDSFGGEMPINPVILEEQRDIAVNSWLRVDRVVYSLQLENTCRSFSVVASVPSKSVRDGFCCMDPGYAADMQARYRMQTKDACGDDALYRKWFEEHRAKATDLALQKEVVFAGGLSFSVVVPCFNSDEVFLREAISSVVEQSYQDWELVLIDGSPEQETVRRVAQSFSDARIRYFQMPKNGGIVSNTNEGIKRAKGTYVAFLDHDDVLEPDALFHYAKAIVEEDACVLYCDEDSFCKIGDYGQPSFKSRFNRDLLYCHNYVTHFLAVKRSLIQQIGLCDERVSGAQDYDLTLRALSAGHEPYHVPRVLYHWRIHAGSSNNGNVDSKPYAIEAGRIALQEHFSARGIAGKVEVLDEPFVYRMHYELPSPKPLISVVIPTQDKFEMLKTCVDSLFSCTYKNIEVILVENGSLEKETFQGYSNLRERYGERLHIVKWNDGFNYSKLINYGVEHAAGEYLLLLNNDTKILSEDCFEEMLGYLQRPEVGVVGAKLFFKNGLVQHAGMLVGPHDALVHAHEYFPDSRPGYLARAIRPGNFSAVTGACQMVKRAVFDEVGGYDDAFAVGFNDADFCLRVGRAGYSIVFSPYAKLYHYEFTSRGREEVDAGKKLRWKREQAKFISRWPEFFVGGDPFSNPNLSRNSMYFQLDD